MRAFDKKKAYRQMVAKIMRDGKISDAKGGWLNASAHPIGQSVVSGARHEKV